MIPTNVLIASIGTLIILMNGTFLHFPKNSRPAEILVKIICGVAAYFWTMAIFGTPSVTSYVVSSCLSFIAFLIGPIQSFEQPNNMQPVITEPIVMQSGGNAAELPFMGKTGKVFCQAGEINTYLGLLDENGDSILVYCKDKLNKDDRFVISDMKDGKIIVDKIK